MKRNLHNIKFQYVDNAWDKKSEKLITQLNLDSAIKSGAIKGFSFRGLIRDGRNAGTEQERKAIKPKLPGFVAAMAECEGDISSDNFKTHSGLIVIDIDCDDNPELLKGDLKSAEELKATLSADDYIFRMFSSPSYGLKLLIKIDCRDKETHERYFIAIRNHFENQYGLKIDESGKDVSRLCFLSYDPELYINNDSKVFPEESIKDIVIEKPKTAHHEINEQTLKGVEFLVQQIEEKKLDITGNYDSWVRIAFALNMLGEQGEEFFVRVSQFHKGFNERKCRKKFKQCTNNRSSGISLGTFFHVCQQAGLKLPRTGTQYLKTPLFPDEVFLNLPPHAAEAVKHSKKNRERDISLLSFITIVSALNPDIFGLYRGKQLYMNLATLIVAPHAAGKGEMNTPSPILHPFEFEKQKEQESLYEAYYKALKKWKESKKNGEEIPKPKKPGRKMIRLPKTSYAAVVKLMFYNASMLFFSSEADTLNNLFAQAWGDWSALLRQAAHHERHPYYNKTNDEHYDLVQPKLSTLLSGTPSQIKTLVDSVENGLFSRFIFYYFTERSEFENPFTQQINLTEYYENLGKEIMEHFELLHSNMPHVGEIEFRFTIEQQEDFYEFFCSQQKELRETVGDQTEGSLFRLGNSFFRIAMILTALRKTETDNGILICEDVDYHTAKLMTKVFIEHVVCVSGLLPKTQKDAKVTDRVNPAFIKDLPDEFQTKEAFKLAKNYNISRRTVYRILNDMERAGVLSKPKQGHYKKINVA